MAGTACCYCNKLSKSIFLLWVEDNSICSGRRYPCIPSQLLSILALSRGFRFRHETQLIDTSLLRAQFLEAAPLVVTLMLAWEPSVTRQDITGTLAAVDFHLDLRDVYGPQQLVAGRYSLRSMFCYYEQHYVAFIYKLGKFVMFDDARITAVGYWHDVVAKCRAGCFQLAVLFYCRV